MSKVQPERASICSAARRFRLAAIVSSLLVASILSGCNSQPPIELDERFLLVGFRDDMGMPRELYKWTAPIRVHTEGATKDQRRMVHEHAELLGRVTGLPVSVDPEDPNLVVLFGNEEELQPYLDDWAIGGDRLNWPGFFRSECFAGISGPGHDPFAVAFILQDLPERKNRLCIVQEMTQALGLFGDIDGRSDTSFASWGGADRLTEFDVMMLEILYDPRLRSGMSEAVAMPIVRQIIAEELR